MEGFDTPLTRRSSGDYGGAIAIQSLRALEHLVHYHLGLCGRAHLLVSCLNIEAVFIVLNVEILYVRNTIILSAGHVAYFRTAASSCSLILYFFCDYVHLSNQVLRIDGLGNRRV